MPITEHLRPGQLEEELAKVEQPREPPVPVDVRPLMEGATAEMVLHGWARSPRGTDGLWGLVTGLRTYAPGFEAEVCWWLAADNIRPREQEAARLPSPPWTAGST